MSLTAPVLNDHVLGCVLAQLNGNIPALVLAYRVCRSWRALLKPMVVATRHSLAIIAPHARRWSARRRLARACQAYLTTNTDHGFLLGPLVNVAVEFRDSGWERDELTALFEEHRKVNENMPEHLDDALCDTLDIIVGWGPVGAPDLYTNFRLTP